MPAMAINSQEGCRPSPHLSSGAHHPHHIVAETECSARRTDLASAGYLHQVSDSHRCCDGSKPDVSIPCATSAQDESRLPTTAAPKLSKNSAVAQSHVPAANIMSEAVS